MDVAPLTDFFNIDCETSTKNMLEVLSSFRCERDIDVQNFLHNNAIKFEKENISRTYLCFNEKGIVGYFTLAIKSLNISGRVSKSLKYKLSGDKYIKSIPAYLLGQLGKNDKIIVDGFGSFIMPKIFEYVKFCKEIVGGKIIYLECKKDETLKLFYEKFGFRYLQETDEYIQMFQYI